MAERRVKKFENERACNYFAFVDVYLDKDNLPIKKWRCIRCGEDIEVSYPEDKLYAHIHKLVRVRRKMKEINFKVGDVLIGLKDSNSHYKQTNSATLLKVEEILDRQFFGDKDIVVSILAYEHKETPEKECKSYLVCSKYFRVATDKDKARFLLNFL
jgi:hypothetical protein